MVPLIRAAAMLPLMRSLLVNGRPVEAMLRRAGIGYLWLEDPFAVVPIRALEAFLRSRPPKGRTAARGASATEASAILRRWA
jgi:hypothetical protein